MAEIGKKMQKSIDALVHDNIYKLKLISKRSDSARSHSYIRSGKKKRPKKAKKRKQSTGSEVQFKPVKSIEHIPQFYEFTDEENMPGKLELVYSYSGERTVWSK